MKALGVYLGMVCGLVSCIGFISVGVLVFAIDDLIANQVSMFSWECDNCKCIYIYVLVYASPGGATIVHH